MGGKRHTPGQRTCKRRWAVGTVLATRARSGMLPTAVTGGRERFRNRVGAHAIPLINVSAHHSEIVKGDRWHGAGSEDIKGRLAGGLPTWARWGPAGALGGNVSREKYPGRMRAGSGRVSPCAAVTNETGPAVGGASYRGTRGRSPGGPRSARAGSPLLADDSGGGRGASAGGGLIDGLGGEGSCPSHRPRRYRVLVSGGVRFLRWGGPQSFITPVRPVG